MSEEGIIDPRWILALIRRRWWLILSCVAIAVLGASVGTSSVPPTYNATATLLILPAGDDQISDYSTLVAGERLALTYSRMLRDLPTLQAAMAQLGLNEKPDKLLRRVKADPVKDTQLIYLTVSDPSPVQAAALANAIAGAFATRMRTMKEERQSGSLASMQQKTDALQGVMDKMQAQADSVAAQNTKDQAQLASLEALLQEYRTDLRSLQQSYQAMQLVVGQLARGVQVMDSAHLVAGASQPPYTATTTLLIDQSALAGVAGTAAAAGDRVAATYAQMIVGRPVLEAALAGLGMSESIDSLARKVKVEPVASTQLMNISVADNDRGQAIRIADAVANAFAGKMQDMVAKPYSDRLAGMQEQMSQLTAQISQAQAESGTLTAATLRRDTELAQLRGLLAEYHSDYRTLQQNYDQIRSAAAPAADAVMISDKAHVPLAPAQGRLRYLVLGALVGVMIGLGLTFLAEYMDETLKAPQDVGRALGLNVLGVVGKVSSQSGELVVATQPQSPPAEAFRMLAASVHLWRPSQPLRTILVTSPCPMEGKSIVAANLAVAMAKSGMHVIIADADLRLPHLHELFGLQREKDVAGYFADGTTEGHLQSTQIAGLQILTGGELSPDPAEVMTSPRMVKLLGLLTRIADVVIIDSPPVLMAADATILAAAADGVLLVLRANQTEIGPAQEAVATLRQAQAQLVGVVLNDVSSQREGYYRRYTHSGGMARARAHFSLVLDKARQRAA